MLLSYFEVSQYRFLACFDASESFIMFIVCFACILIRKFGTTSKKDYILHFLVENNFFYYSFNYQHNSMSFLVFGCPLYFSDSSTWAANSTSLCKTCWSCSLAWFEEHIVLQWKQEHLKVCLYTWSVSEMDVFDQWPRNSEEI